MKLFEEYPYLENDVIAMSRLTEADIPGLEELTAQPDVGATIPTFLYEYKYEDKREMLAHMDEECFDTKESILLGVRSRSEAPEFYGIAEIYNYEEEKQKASIGYRLLPSVWGKGIATQEVELLKEYLFGETGLRTITAHVLRENKRSAHVLEKNGFVNLYPGVMEDWGRGEPQLTDKYVLKKRWLDQC